MSRDTQTLKPDSQELPSAELTVEPGKVSRPLDWLPKLGRSQVRLEHLLSRWYPGEALPRQLSWLDEAVGGGLRIERPEILWRASGIGRPGLIVQLTVPRLGARLGLGIEIPLAHQVVDRLLGFDRAFAQSRLQITPVEWGVWSFLILRALHSLAPDPASQRDQHASALLPGPADMTLDRVGPDEFDPTGLGSIVTIRWPVQVGNTEGAVRFWIPESLVQLWLASSWASADPAQPGAETIAAETPSGASTKVPRGELSGAWRAIAGSVALPQGLRRLRTGGVWLISETRLLGSARNPSGEVDLILDLDDQESRFRFPATPVADSGARLLRLEAGILRERRPRDPIDGTKSSRTPMSQPPTAQNPSTPPGVAPLDVPVTLTVELGRVNLTLDQIAALKPGDVVELGRHSRAPVELTSNGRLIARGELVQIDTDLGVRVTNIFL